MKILKGGKHPQTIAEEQSKQQADKNAKDPGLIAKAIEKLKELSKK